MGLLPCLGAWSALESLSCPQGGMGAARLLTASPAWGPLPPSQLSPPPLARCVVSGLVHGSVTVVLSLSAPEWSALARHRMGRLTCAQQLCLQASGNPAQA